MSTVVHEGGQRQAETGNGSRGERRMALFSLENRVGRISAQIAFLVAVLLTWHWFTVSGLIPKILVAGPLDVLNSLWTSMQDIATGGSMAEHFWTSAQEILLGFAFATLIGVAMGALIAEFKPIRTLVVPYVVALNSMPRIAIAPMVLVWFGFGTSSKIVMSLLTATFPILIATATGLTASDRATQRLMRAYGATRWQTFRKVKIYDALPYFFAGLEIGITLATVGAIVGEFMGGNAGLGYVILVAQESLNLPLVFSTLILLSFLGTGLHRLVLLLRGRVIYWKTEDDEKSIQKSK